MKSDFRAIPECVSFEVTFVDIVDNSPHRSSPCIFTSMESLHTVEDVIALVSDALHNYHGDVLIRGIRELPSFSFIIELAE